MHIVHLVHQYPPEHLGGTELYTQQVANQQVARGHSVSVFVPSAVTERKVDVRDEGGVRVYRVGVGERSRTRVFLDTFGNQTLLDVLDAFVHSADIVHIQHLMGIPHTILDHIQRAGKPIVITLHDYWFPCANAQLITNTDNTICTGPDAKWHNCGRCAVARAGLGQRPLLARSLRRLMRRRHKALHKTFSQADAVIAPTNFVRDTYRNNRFDHPNFVVIRHGIEALAPKQSRERADNRFHAVFVGSIAWQKGVHMLVEAFNQLPQGDFRLTIAGGLDTFPDYAKDLQGRVRHEGVEFVGRLTREAVWELLGSADIAILPTLWYEASPLTIDEFFAAQVPIIASNIGAMPEKIRHKVDGLLIPPNDATALRNAMARLHQDRDLLQQLRTNIRPVRTIGEHVTDIEQLYASLRKRQ